MPVIGTGLALLLFLPLALNCFFGYRLFRFFTALSGFIVGAVIGGVLGAALLGVAGAVLLGLILGALCGYFAFKLYKLGVFVVCFGAGALIGAAFALLAKSPGQMIALAGVGGFILGVLGVTLTKPVIILSTAAGGGMGAGMMLGTAFDNSALGIILGIIFLILGILLQFWWDAESSGEGNEAEEAPKEELPEKPETETEERGDIKTKEEDNVRSLFLPNMDAVADRASNVFSSLKSGATAVGRKIQAGVQGVAESKTVLHLLGDIRNTKTVHPLRGWNELARLPAPLWMPDLPVIVTEACIAVPGEGGKPALALGLQNLSVQAVLGVFFSVRCFDLLRQELQGIPKFSVQDFRLNPGEIWFSENPFILPDNDTRQVELTVSDVVLEDFSIWKNEEGRPLEALTKQSALTLPRELSETLAQSCQADVVRYEPLRIFRYTPKEEAGGWFCACGQFNSDERCIACGIGKEKLFGLFQPGRLEALWQERAAEQRRQNVGRR